MSLTSLLQKREKELLDEIRKDLYDKISTKNLEGKKNFLWVIAWEHWHNLSIEKRRYFINLIKQEDSEINIQEYNIRFLELLWKSVITSDPYYCGKALTWEVYW